MAAVTDIGMHDLGQATAGILLNRHRQLQAALLRASYSGAKYSYRRHHATIVSKLIRYRS